VVHNGKAHYAKACAALSAFRRQGGTVILVTNAPRPFPPILEQLARLGAPSSAYDGIVTSGDVTLSFIVERGEAPLYHIGPERDLPLLGEQAALRVPLEEAGYIVCSGLYDDETETPDDYAAMLEQALASGLDMVCANPDLVVERGPRLIYCAGALAERYREMGGKALYAGKPHAPIYQAAHLLGQQLLGRDLSRQRILAIGDAFYTVFSESDIDAFGGQ
jgi:HAD superfamily hydrolase (TIGR01459 family)